MTEVLWDVRLFDPDTGTATEHQAIEFHGDTVVGIREAVGEPPDGAHVLGGATVLPGLIDAHVHVASDTSRSPGFGPPPAQHGEPPRPAGAGALHPRRDGRPVPAIGLHDGSRRRGVRRRGPRPAASPSTTDSSRGRGCTPAAGSSRRRHPVVTSSDSMYREADGPWEMRKAVREQLRRGAEFIKFMATGARSVVLEDPEPAQMTLEEMKAIVDEAHRMGKRVAAHAEGLEGTRWALEAGADTIEHGLSLHREPVLLDDMAERGTVLVPTLSTFHDLAERFANDLPGGARRASETAVRGGAAHGRDGASRRRDDGPRL